MTITYPDPLPFKLRVQRALTDCLKDISPDDDYVYDMADFDNDGVTTARVYRGRAWFGASDPIPMLSILEGVSPADEVAEPPTDTASGEYLWAMHIQGFVDDDPLNPTDPAYLLLSDVRRRLAAERNRKRPGTRGQPDPFGLGAGKNTVTGLSFGPGVVRPADDVSAKAYFWLSLYLKVLDNPEFPYE